MSAKRVEENDMDFCSSFVLTATFAQFTSLTILIAWLNRTTKPGTGQWTTDDAD